MAQGFDKTDFVKVVMRVNALGKMLAVIYFGLTG